MGVDIHFGKIESFVDVEWRWLCARLNILDAYELYK